MCEQSGRRTLFLRKEFFQYFGILSPVLVDLHSECEIDLLSENLFENETGIRPDSSDFFSSFPDHDDLLRVCFDIDIGNDGEERLGRLVGSRVRSFSKLFLGTSFFLFPASSYFLFDRSDLDIGGIGNLVTEFEKELFPDHFLNTQIH